MKIKDLTVGSSCEITLVVKSATARETKAKKPYLQLEFYDGCDTINGNYWDWATGNIPEVNSILDVTCQVTEWQGTKQLTVKAMSRNNTRLLSEFAPAPAYDIGDTYKDAYALASKLDDDLLRGVCLGILEELRVRWLEVPGASRVHHAYVGGTLIHSLHVAQLAKVIAEHIPGANVELCIAGGLLHDLGKLFTYRMNGINIEMTDEGLLYEHTFMGAEFVGNYADLVYDSSMTKEYKVRILRHIILSHHGHLEYGAAVTPKCIEAVIVNAADGIDAATEQIRAAAAKTPEGTKWTERIYTMQNSQFLVPDFIGAIFE